MNTKNAKDVHDDGVRERKKVVEKIGRLCCLPWFHCLFLLM